MYFAFVGISFKLEENENENDATGYQVPTTRASTSPLMSSKDGPLHCSQWTA